MTMPKGFLLTSAAAMVIAFTMVGTPEPAHAQFGISIGGFPLGIGVYGHRGYRGGGGRRPRGSRDDASQSDGGGRSGKPDKVVAGQGAPSSSEQTKVLQQIASSGVVTDVGSTKDLNEVGQQTVADSDSKRDYTLKITEIIDLFKKEERKGREEARRELRGEAREMTSGDVTAHAIELSLEKAVKNAKLDTFERFVNEAWTSERLRVLILERVLTDLPPLFEGNNRGSAPMEALELADPACIRLGLPAHLRNLRAARRQQEFGAVHAAPLSDARRAGG